MAQLYQSQDLTPEQIQIILNSVPILEQAGETLTAKFYKKMLSDYDEVKPFFNETDQKLLRQPKILAFALLNYAKHIEDLTPLGDFVKQIVSKHVGLQVKAEHYPIVGKCLLETMVDLLPSEVANEEFLNAWAIAYGNLAKILIDSEATEYDKSPWQGFREFKVTKIVPESDDVKSVYFTPNDEGHISAPLRGQYVCIRWLLPGDLFEKSREYSLSEYPSHNEYRISVRKLEGGKVSTFIHETLNIGDTLSVAPPCGSFVYSEGSNEVVMIAGGIGITPLISIIDRALDAGSKVVLLNSNRNSSVRPFADFFKEKKTLYGDKFTLTEYFSNCTKIEESIDKVIQRKLELPDLDFIKPSDEVYLLGPRGYMKSIKAYLEKKGIKVKLEYFGPLDV
ncbi:Yhb1 nitric oxide dioxygenase [Scheffersomyces amazonensis]|uniref:Yhb1 nitric oxide dioxygenase n=1 Tax=Scheffersomyces amazonensis TaxID=1078765 RepID=UPI00315D4003